MTAAPEGVDPIPTIDTPVALRDYGPEDAGGCLSLFDSNTPPFFLPYERPQFTEFLSGNPKDFLVLATATVDLLACGGLARGRVEGRVDLCWGMVLRNCHRQGFGRQLLRARIAQALADPAIRVVHLNTSKYSAGFFEREGFVVDSVELDGYGPGLDRYELHRDLHPGGSDTVMEAAW